MIKRQTDLKTFKIWLKLIFFKCSGNTKKQMIDLMTVLHLAEISLADESSKCLWLVLMKTVVLKFPRCSLFSAAKSCLSLTSEYDRDVAIK